jgi:hypothetical protein
VRQRTLGSALDRGAVGHRIGKRHAELDDVGAARHQGAHQRQAGIRVRVARGDEGNQGLAALAGEGCEGFLDA